VQRVSNLAAPWAKRHRNMVDQGTDGVGRLVALLRMLKSLGMAFYVPALDDGDIGMNVGGVYRRTC
jgi:hypothetical protein